MATWKKIVVSGSFISQLNNDAGYLTAGTLTQANGFATASFNGTSILADNITGSLNFASSSGQGLTISANAGNDTLTFGLSAVPNSSLANSAITIAGTSTSLGGSITAATILTGTGVWSGSAQLPVGIVSGSAQVTALLPTGTVSGSSQISYSGISGVPTGIISGSSLGSANQGEVYIITNGVQQSAVDLGLQTSDSPTFNSLVLNGNLTVFGTASFQNTANLQVADRFVLFASGSNTTGDGGFVVQQGTQNVGELFGWNSTAAPLGRWAVTSSFNAASGSYTPDAFMAAVLLSANVNPNTSSPASRYNAAGNIYVSSGDDSIWIYS